MMEDRKTKYWIIVASKDHVKNGVSAGIAQACHGKASPLKRMKKGDYILFYSSKQTLGQEAKCQAFTAIGRLADDETYTHQVSAEFCPSRRNVTFMKAHETSILPLIQELDFIPNKKSWGYPFRFGILEINSHDFDLISSKMLKKEYA